MRIVYMGTPDFAVGALEAIQNSRHDIVGVFTQPDRPSGRGKKLAPPPVKTAALAHGLAVFQPEKLRGNDQAWADLDELKPDIAVVAAYGQILPQRFLDIPRLGCINIHASLLPRHRGASPIQAAILSGDPQTGVTIMQMEAGLDTGPMLDTRATPIHALDTAQTLHDRLAGLGADMIVQVLDALEAGTLAAAPQDDELSTYAPMLKKTDGILSFRHPAAEVSQKVRGLNPWPGAQASLVRDQTEERIKILLATPAQVSIAGPPGTILVQDRALFVQCLDQPVEILELQPAGSRAMSARDFLNGFKLDNARFL